MAGKKTEALPQPQREQVQSRPRSPVVLGALMATEGVAFAVLFGLDGSPGWRAVRVLVVIAATALAVWFTLQARRTGRGTAAFLSGIAGAVAGAGVASGHLAKAGLDAAAVLAVIVLAAGTVLLIWGAATLVRAMPGWWRLLAVPGAVVLPWFVLWPLTIAVYATNLPPGTLDPAEAGMPGVRRSFARRPRELLALLPMPPAAQLSTPPVGYGGRRPLGHVTVGSRPHPPTRRRWVLDLSCMRMEVLS